MQIFDRFISSSIISEHSIELIALSCYHLAKKLRTNMTINDENEQLSLIFSNADYNDEEIFVRIVFLEEKSLHSNFRLPNNSSLKHSIGISRIMFLMITLKSSSKNFFHWTIKAKYINMYIFSYPLQYVVKEIYFMLV